MLKKYGIDDSKIFKIAVIATMSSGKSTFINALIGEDILPAQNQACTAKIIPILDNDKAENFKAYVEYKDSKKKIVNLNDANIIHEFNFNTNIKDILIEGNIKGIRNCNRASVLIDTPGTNFSGDETHMEQTYELIEEINEGMILYVINATQFGINDDLKLLIHINDKVKKTKGKLKILFVVNKIDEFDLEKEDIKETMQEIQNYLISSGINEPQIVPISALAAKLFKMALNERTLTRKELREFDEYYQLFKPKGYDLTKYALVKKLDDQDKNIKVGENTVKKGNIIRAIENTGIAFVEELIEQYLMNTENAFNPIVRFKEKKHKKMNILLMETSGSNNSRIKEYRKLVDTVIKDKNSIILYVINVTQLGINDEAETLYMISDSMKMEGKQLEDRFVFVMNKCEQYNFGDEKSINNLLKGVTMYLTEYGIQNPRLFPVSAETAKLISMHQNGIELTRNEEVLIHTDVPEIEEAISEYINNLSTKEV